MFFDAGLRKKILQKEWKKWVKEMEKGLSRWWGGLVEEGGVSCLIDKKMKENFEECRSWCINQLYIISLQSSLINFLMPAKC
jgi:hypothetical protein